MINFFIRRILLCFITLFILIQIGFCLLYFTPNQIWPTYPFFKAYPLFYLQLFSGKWGFLLIDNHLFIEQLKNHVTATLELCLCALLVSFIIGLPLGIYAGINYEKTANKIIQFFYVIATATPIMWLALFAIVFFSHSLNWLPDLGRFAKINLPENYSGFLFIDIWLSKEHHHIAMLWITLRHLILPSLLLAILPTAEVMYLVRGYTNIIYKKNFIKAALARGLPQTTVIKRHLLHNALPPLLPKLCIQFPTVLTLMIAIEIVFDWQGIGAWLLNALTHHHYPVIVILCLLIGALCALIYLIGDMINLLMQQPTEKDLYAER